MAASPLYDVVPSPSIAPARWPGLIASVGGEAAIREFMRTNATENGGNHWEGGIQFRPNDCLTLTTPVQDCNSLAFSYGEAVTNSVVTSAPLYYWDSASCSTLGNNPDEVTRRALSKLDRSISYKLERELWLGTQHTALGLPDQSLADITTVLNGGAATPFVRAMGDLAQAWGNCSEGARAMIHVTPRTAAILASSYQTIRKENGLLLDAFDNIVVAGSGYTGTKGLTAPGALEAYAFITPVVNVRLADAEAVMTEPSNGEDETRVDIPNNFDRAVAFRSGAVSYDDCCTYAILINLATAL